MTHLLANSWQRLHKAPINPPAYNQIATEQSPPTAKMSKVPKYPYEDRIPFPAIYGVGEWAYSKKDRNEKGEPTGKLRYISDARYIMPSTPDEDYTGEKWQYLLKDGPGEKAQEVGWTNEEDLEEENPRGPEDLIDMSP